MARIIAGLILYGLCVLDIAAEPATPPAIDIASTVVRVPLSDGVSMDDAVDSMKLRANVLNFKLVAHQPLSKELEAMGIKSGRLEIFQFCDPRIAHSMVRFDMNFAAYLPCRIAMLEDESGKAWLVMMNLDMFINSANLPTGLKENAIKVRDSLNEIIHAGANGDL